jgi:membrane-associated phospholipid phosphatase
VLRQNRHFLVPYFIFLITAGIVFLFADKASIHLFLNKYHTDLTDKFFKYITYVGDGVVVLAVAVIYMFIRLRHAFLIGISYLLSSLVTQLLKNLVFKHNPRPVAFFENTKFPLRLVPDVEMNHWNSFPSGHSSAAFTLFFCLALITENTKLKLIYFILSLLVAFSRVYLSQHFLVDIYAGSIIGVVTAILIFKWMETASHFRDKQWLDKPIYSFKS